MFFSGTRCLLILATPELRTSCKEVSLPRGNLLDQLAAPKVLCQTTESPKNIQTLAPTFHPFRAVCHFSTLEGREKKNVALQASIRARLEEGKKGRVGMRRCFGGSLGCLNKTEFIIPARPYPSLCPENVWSSPRRGSLVPAGSSVDLLAGFNFTLGPAQKVVKCHLSDPNNKKRCLRCVSSLCI